MNINVPTLETLQSSLAYVTTRYSMTVSLQLQHCPACTALMVVDHLERLISHPEVQESDVLSSTYRGLLAHWEALSEHQATRIEQAATRSSSVSSRLH